MDTHLLSLADVARASRMRTLLASGEAEAIRRRARITRAEVARAVGVTYECVRKWEAGERRPRERQALRYFAVLEALERRQ